MNDNHGMQVRALNTTDEIKRYIEFGDDVYRNNPNWVPPDAHHLTQLLSGEGGFGPQSQIQPLLVEKDGSVLATVTAFTDEAYNRHWNERIGHLFFFEALPNHDDAVKSLMNTACEWLQSRGCNAARLSFMAGIQMPLMYDGYDEVPTVFHTYNPSYYHNYIKNSGFATERGVVQYQVEFTPDLAERYKEMVERASSGGITLRTWDFDQLEKETDSFMRIGNETFKAHFGFMPLPKAVYEGLTFGLKDFLISDLMLFAEDDGQIVGFVYSLPDLNQALQPMRGKNLEENIPEFQERFKGIDHGVLLIIGVHEDYRGRGVNLALGAKSYLAMIDRGYKTGSYTVVMDDNWPSRRTAEKLGCRVTRNFNVYRRDFL